MARAIKDRGIDWIGEIPASWKLSRVKNHYNIISGSGFKPEFQGNPKGDFPVCKASDISNAGNKLTIAANYITKQIATSEGFTVIPKGSLLFAKIGEAMKKNNRTIATVDCCVDNNCQGLVPKNINVEYGFYLFKCIDMEWFDNAGTIPCINNQKLLSLSLPFPPLPEQQKIAAFLDKQCSEIDAVLTKTKESIEEYKLLKNAIITQAVTKGIRPNRKMKDSGIEWIGEIPEEWKVLKLKFVSKTRNQKYSEEFGKLNYFGLENIESQSSRFIETDNQYDLLQSQICKQGDIAFGKLRPYLAKVYEVPKDECCSLEFALFYDFDGLNKFYKYLFLSYGFVTIIDASTYGTKMPRANIDFIENMSIPIPLKTEQMEIVNYLDEKTSVIDTLITKKEQLITELETYKKSLIYEYVTGKKEVQ